MNVTMPEARSAVSAALVASLHCPYCGSDLEQVLQVRVPEHSGSASHALYGVLRCACSTYPLIEGIPILQRIAGLDGVVEYVKRKETRLALLHAMNVFRVTWAHRTRWHQALFYLNCRRLVAGPHLRFEDAIGLVRKPKGFGDYLFHRYANPSFLVDVALLPALGAFLSHRPQGRVLDLACGAGHSSFLMRRWFPDASIVSVDQDFVSLYLAKRFLAPEAEYVCTDVEVPSPFPDNSFDAVHCLDAFHYLRAKQAIVAELRRVAKADALWLFPHLHNALAENVTPGIPLAPEHYARCFEFVDPVLFDEADLHEGLANRGHTDPIRPRRPDDLSGAKSLALLGGATEALRERTPLSSWLRSDTSTLTINPIYQGEWRGDRLSLKMRWPNPVLHRECREVEAILPASIEVARADLEQIAREDGSADDQLIRDLIGRFVLVSLPRGYSRRDPITVSPAH
jgi:SAM-dependent methyltransferase